MKKKYLFTFLLVLMTFMLFSLPVTELQVKRVAQNLSIERNGQFCEIESISFLNQDPKSGIYITKLLPSGFVLVAGDDASQPILGYDFINKWTGKNIPVQLEDFLQSWTRQLTYIAENNLVADRSIRAEWQRLDVESSSFTPLRNDRAVSPLISTTWGQEGYYNDLCPSNTPVGCVATAMAQIMRYWSYPTVGQGSHSYVHPVYGSQTANFGGTTYNWAGMPNQVGSPNTSVATLGYHAGVAVEMDYDPTGSGAYSTDVPGALISYFKYKSTAILRYKSAYSDANWNTLLQGELNNARPVYYAGSGPDGGHAFIIDGFSGTTSPYYYHFNWGWDGYYNGNYYLSNLNPGGYNFTTGQEAVVGIEPSASGATTLAEGFEGTTFPPMGWTLSNGGDANTWVRNTTAGYPRTGSACASITYNSTTAHNDWLISPRLSPTAGNYTFSFYAKNIDASYLDLFNVKLSTTTNATASFTVSLAANQGPGTTYTLYTYNLSAYVGQNVYVAIQAISRDMFKLCVDDVVGPPLYVNPNPTAALNITAWAAGELTPGNSASSGSIFQLSNTGQGILTITSVTNLSASEFKSTINTGVALVPGQIHEFGFTYDPLNYGTDNQTFQIVTNGGTVSISLSGSAAYHYFSDSFETYNDFVISFPPWTNTDVDGYATYGFTGYSWTNAYAAQAFIIFNPSTVTPALTDANPHTGNKAAWCLPATTFPNNDYLITPQLTLTGTTTVSFWAKSYFGTANATRFRVQYSTTTNAVASFTSYLAGSGTTSIVPTATWTNYSYTLPTTARYVAIHCVSSAADLLMIDDFIINDGSTPPTPYFGHVSGYVYEYGTTNPITNAYVQVGSKTAITNASGFYQISNLMVGTYAGNCTTPGADYFSSSASGIAITSGNTTSQNFYLKWSELAVNATSFTTNLFLGESDEQTLTISNPGGTANLTYSMSLASNTAAASPRSNMPVTLSLPATENHRIPERIAAKPRVAVEGSIYYGDIDAAAYYTDYVTERATKFTISDWGLWSNSGVTISQLETYFCNAASWGTEDTFVFKIYAANGSTVLHTSTTLTAVPDDASYIYPTTYTLPTPLTIDGDFYVAVVPEGTTTGFPYGVSTDYSLGHSYYGSAGAWTALGEEEHIISAFINGNWLISTSGGTGTVIPAGSEDITITFDTTDLSVGTYQALLTISNDSNYIAPSGAGAPRGDDMVVPITLNVMLATYGDVEGHVYYSGTTTPVVNAVVSISSWTDTTDVNGYYLLEDVPSETTDPLTVTATGCQDYSNSITILANQTNTYNVYLDYSKFSTPQTVFDLTCATGSTTSGATTLQNVGSHAIDWTSDSGVWGGNTYLGGPLDVDWEDNNMTGWTGSVGYYSDLYGSVTLPYGHNSLVTWAFNSNGVTDVQYIISPRLNVQSTDALTFWYKQFNNSSESLEILVSTTDNAIGSFTTRLATIGPLADTTWVQFNQSLSSFAGQNIYICFNYPRIDGYEFGYVFIDDITGPNVYLPYTEWLSCSPASGSLVSGGSVPLTLNANASTLPVGTYTAETWVFGDATNSPYKLNVTLTVAAAQAEIPVNVTISRESGENFDVLLNWDASDNAARYHVYACADSLDFDYYTHVGVTNSESIVITQTDLANAGITGNNVFFKVTADNESMRYNYISKSKTNQSYSPSISRIKSMQNTRQRFLKRI